MKSRTKIFSLREIFSSGLMIIYIIINLVYQQHMFDDIITGNQISIFLGFVLIVDFLGSKDFSLNLEKYNKNNFIFLALFFFVLVNSFLIRKQFLFGALFNITVSYVIAKKINNFKLYSWILLIPFWFLVIYILNRLIINPNPANVFLNSRNYISFYLIITVLPYYFLTQKNKINYSIVPAIFVLLLSLYSLGRSGIVASLIIFLSVLLERLRKGGALVKFLIIIFTAFIIYLFFDFLNDIDESKELNRFSSSESFLSDGGRSSILSQYIEKMDFQSFLFGMNTEVELKYILSTFSHLHSSLLNFYSVIGSGMLIFIYYVINKFLFLKKNKHYDMFFLFLALLIRISTDVGVLFGYFDYVIWMFFVLKKN